MQDRFGREITNNDDGTYSVNNGGIIVSNIATLDAMAPIGWIEPE